MLKTVLSYFWGNDNSDISLEDVYTVLNSVNSNEVNEESNPLAVVEDSNFACHHKIGTVTKVDHDKFVIDGIYESKQTDLIPAIGAKVSFIAYTSDDKINASNVSIIDNEWNCNEGEQKTNWCNRCLISKVVKREGRNIFISPGDISFNLNCVRIEFIPIIGDWLELDVKCEVDESVTDLFGRILEINKISPVRPKIVEGVVKTWDVHQQIGTINQNIFFNREALNAGYIPALADKIVAEIVESEQGRCSWRALKIVPHNISNNISNLNLFQNDFENEDNAVFISEDVFINADKINDTQLFEFKVVNESTSDVGLLNVKFENVKYHCTIVKPHQYPVLLKPREHVFIQGCCNIKTAGQSRVLLVFVFKDFSINRWVNITNKAKVHGNIGRYEKKNYGASNLYNDTLLRSMDVIKGQKPIVPPRFIPYHLPEYPVPQKLWGIFQKYGDNHKDTRLLLEELILTKPVLNKSLSFHCYEERFHTLLHLEEISNITSSRIYDRENVCFIKNGDFLMLEIENLSEQRPSIICGDSFIASDPHNKSTVKLEGNVYKVGAKHIYLKFTQVFHDTYDGEDYSVRLVQTRTLIRKLHQAVGLAVRSLGREYLFPTKIENKICQSNFSYDKYDDLLDQSINKEVADVKGKEEEIEIVKFRSPYKLSNAELLKLLRSRKKTGELETSSENNSAKINSNLMLEVVEQNQNEQKRHIADKFKLEWFNKTLNYYQKEAVRNVLLGEARPLPYFIFGPPGTGKTVTLVETILQLVRLVPHSRFLVTTPSNSAADLIAVRLIDSGILKPGDLVRFVAYRCVAENIIPPKLVPYSATCNIGKEGTSSQSTVITENGLVLGISSSVLGRQRITVGTCAAVGSLFSMGFPKGHFTHIIVDEAAQATEPEIMIPLSFLDTSSGQVIIAGDPMQLGPVVTSKYATELGLTESFMERMLNRFPYIRDIEGFPNTGGYDPRLVMRLVYNYRSLPEILELPNSMFYFSELLPTISAVDSVEAKLLYSIREILPLRENGLPSAFVFHGVNGADCQTLDSPSWFNPDEASQIFYYVNELYRLGFTSKDVGIISPYIKQVREVRSLLAEAEFEVPKIGTVEEFQGQEFNVIMLSTVRSTTSMVESDKKYNLGFVANPRRLNVALTRAQILIIIIGNPHLLATDPYWRNVLTYALRNGSYCGCDFHCSLKLEC